MSTEGLRRAAKVSAIWLLTLSGLRDLLYAGKGLALEARVNLWRQAAADPHRVSAHACAVDVRFSAYNKNPNNQQPTANNNNNSGIEHDVLVGELRLGEDGTQNLLGLPEDIHARCSGCKGRSVGAAGGCNKVARQTSAQATRGLQPSHPFPSHTQCRIA